MFNSIGARFGAVGALVLLASCNAPEEPAATPTLASLPPEVCARAGQELQRLAGTAVFEPGAKGSGTIEEAAWLQLGKGGQDQLAQTLALDAACAASEMPREQQIVIRAADGRTLMSRVIEIVPDLGDFLEE
jgi:hypothetical protein